MVIVRELIDESVGLTAGNSNHPQRDQAGWSSYRDRIERAARDAASQQNPAGQP